MRTRSSRGRWSSSAPAAAAASATRASATRSGCGSTCSTATSASRRQSATTGSSSIPKRSTSSGSRSGARERPEASLLPTRAGGLEHPAGRDKMRTMRSLLPVGVVAAVAGVAALTASAAAPARPRTRDTIELTGGARVRLVQIDTPELGTGECYSHAAARVLSRWLPRGSAVTLEADPRLDQVDGYGRLLRYVWSRGRNLNLQLVRDGAATVYLYHGDTGKYAARLLAAARAARAAHRGLWGACPRAVWDPYGPATTGQSGPPAQARRSGGCDPSYPDVCIAPPPPDLDCKSVPYRHFRVLPPDPQHFD